MSDTEQLKQELDQLEKQISPEVETKEEPTVNLIEQDGELYISSESDNAGTDADLDERQSNQQSAESGDSNTNENEQSSFQDKSKEDLIDMVVNAQKMIGDQSSEIGELRKITAKDEDLSESELLERLTADDVQSSLNEEKTKLDGIDPYDYDSVETQKEVIRSLESDLINKRTQEHLESRFNSRDNEAFVAKMKDRFVQDGIELADDEFKPVNELASNYTESGLLTEGSYHKAMVDHFGYEKVAKHYQMSGERKARADIQNASAKQTEKVDVRGTGKNAKMIRIADLSQRELRSTLDNLSVEELNKLNAQINN